MSRLRKISLIAAVPLGLAAILFGLACLPAVQTWAVRRVLSAQPDTQAELGRVAIGWNSVRVTDLTLTQPGLRLHLPSLDLQAPVLAAARGQVDVASLTAHGWTLDLTDTDVAVPSGEPKPVDPAATLTGVFKTLELPVDLSIKTVDLAGQLVLPAGRAELTLTGGQLAPGSEGRFTLETALTPDPRLHTGVDVIEARAELRARLLNANTFDRLALDFVATARGADVPADTTLHVRLDSQSTTAGGETHALRLVAGERDLIAVDLALPANLNAGSVTGQWRVDIRDTDLKPFALSWALAAFQAEGGGEFASDIDGNQPSVSGKLILKAGQLDRLAPELAGVGPLTLTTGFDLARVGERVRVRRLTLDIADTAPVFSAATLQGFTFDPASATMLPEQAVNDLASLTLSRLPLAWVQPWLPELTVNGGDAAGEWRVALRDEMLMVRPVAPVTVAGLNLDQAGEPLLREVDVSLAAGVARGAAGWRAELVELTLRRGERAMLKLAAVAGQLAGADQPLTLTGTYDSDLRAVVTQPFASEDIAVTAGRIQGDFSGSLSADSRFELSLGVTGLRAAVETGFPEVALTAVVTQNAAGRIEVEVPVVVTTPGQRSEAVLKAGIVPGEPATNIAATLTSALLYSEHLNAFGALTAAAGESVKKPPANEPEEPKTNDPFWAGLTGELVVDVQRLVYLPGVEITAIHAALKIGPDGLSLDDLRALVGAQGKLEGAARVLHDAAQAEPYEVKGNVRIKDFDPGPFLRASEPRRAPVIEGSFDLTAELAGRAVEPAELADAALGEVRLTGRDGTLRALGVKVGRAAELASPAAAVLGLFGSMTGNESAQKYAGRAQAGAEVVRQLGALDFEQMTLTLSRDAERNLAIRDLTLDSSLARLVGAGLIRNQPGVPLFRQPLALDLQLSARNRLASGLRALNLLSAEVDEHGYTPLVEVIKLDGSLESVGTAQLQRLIERALLD